MNHIVYLDVEDQICKARVKEVFHPHHALYHVAFEDGYENMFFTDVETNEWMEEDLGPTSLAEAFGRKMRYLAFNPLRCNKILHWHFCYVQNKWIHFGFFNFEEDNCSVYEIYGGNRKFKYNLVNKGDGNWEIYGAYNLMLSEFDLEQADIIIKILEAFSSCP